MSKARLLVLCAAVFFSATISKAVEITGVTIRGVSTELGWGAVATNLVSGVGINPTGAGEGTFSTDYTTMWLSGDWVASDEWIEFDLHKRVAITDIKIWNYNQLDTWDATLRGVYEMRVGFSNDGLTWTDEGLFQITKAPGDTITPFADTFSGGYSSEEYRYIRFEIASNYGGPGDVGLSQVKFYGTPAANAAPIVDAGANQEIKAPNTATMNATVSDDGVPSPITRTWTQASGPATAVFSNASALNPVVTFPSAGMYVLRLSASDGEYTESDTVNVRVLPANWNAISGVTGTGYSSVWSFARYPSLAVNGLGLIENGVGGHVTAADGTMWSSSWPVVVADQYFLMDLGAKYVLNNARLWNFNEGVNATMGVAEFELLASASDPTVVNGTSLGVFTAAQAPGTEGSDYSEVFTISNANLFRYVRFNVHSNHGFDQCVGVAELMFSGNKNGCASQLAGDLDGNCKVNFADIAVVAADWLKDTRLN